MKRNALVVGASTIAIAAAGTAVLVTPLAADPQGEKDCGGGALPLLEPEVAASAQAPERR